VTATNVFGANSLLVRHTNSLSVFYTFDLSGGSASEIRWDARVRVRQTGPDNENPSRRHSVI
jgi:hypothetical protein